MRGTLLFRTDTAESGLVAICGVLRMPRGVIQAEQFYEVTDCGKVTRIGNAAEDLGYLTIEKIMRSPLFSGITSKVLFFRKTPGRDLDTPSEEAFLVGGFMPIAEQVESVPFSAGILMDVTSTSQVPVDLEWVDCGDYADWYFSQNLYLEERWCIPSTLREDCLLQGIRENEVSLFSSLQDLDFASSITEKRAAHRICQLPQQTQAWRQSYLKRRAGKLGSLFGHFPMTPKDKAAFEREQKILSSN